MEYKTKQLHIGLTWINYAEIGQGPCIILIHGMTNNWENFKLLASFLDTRYKLILVDLPGYGDSGKLANYSVSKMARYTKRFITKLRLKPISVVGLSMGGIIVSEFIKKYPRLSASAIVMSPVLEDKKRKVFVMKYTMKTFKTLPKGSSFLKLIMSTKTSSYFLAKFLNMYKFNKELIDKYGYEGKKKMTKEAYIQMAISIAEYNLNKTLEKVKKPTLLLYGEKDKISSFAYAQKTVLKQNKNLNLATVPDAGHVVSLEKPKETSEKIMKFLNSLDKD